MTKGLFTFLSMITTKLNLRRLSTFSLFILMAFTAHSQGSWIWAKGSLGGGSDIGNASVTDPGGNVYATGSFDGASITFGTATLSNPGVQQMFVVKYNSAGAVQWAYASSSFSVTSGEDLTVDASGNVYITGGFDATATFGTTNLTNGGIYIVKLNSSGVLQWAVAPTGIIGYANGGKSIALDVSGNIIIAGRYVTSVIFGSTTLSGLGVFVAKYNSTGTPTWATSATTTNVADINDMTLDASGNVYITGHFGPNLSFGSTSYTSVAGEDYFIAKYSSSGVYQWSAAAGGLDNDYGFSIAADANNNIYTSGVIGATSTNVPFGSFTLSASGYIKGFVTKYNSSGTAAWVQGVGGTTSSVNANALAIDGNGDIYIAGQYYGGSTLTLGSNTLTNASTSPLYSDIFVAKMNASGTMLWGKGAGGGSVDDAYGIAVDVSGNVFITGWSNTSPIPFDTVSVPNAGSNYIGYTAKLGGACTAAPTQPGAITGSTSACASGLQTYSVAAVTGATSYTWTLPAGWTGTSSGNSITATAGTTGGTISVTAINACGSSSVQSLAVSVSPGPSATITAAGPTIFCQGNSVTLNATTGSGYTYQWQLNGTNLPGATSNAYSAAQAGSYTVILSTGTCNATSAATTVTVNQPPAQPGTITGATSVCAGSLQTYSVATVAGATTYTWNLPNGWTGTSNTNTITATAAATGGILSVTATNSCGNSTSPILNVASSTGPSATITAAGPMTFCQGGSVTLNANTGTGYTYQWKLNGTVITAATANSYIASQGGSYTVVINSGSCTATSSAATVTVNALPLPAITQTGNTLSATATFSTYQWYKNNVLIPGATNQSYTVTQSGSYYVKVTNTNNCTGQSNALTVTINAIGDITTDEALVYPSPNHGVFSLKLAGKKITGLRIYNAQGQTVRNHSTTGRANSVTIELENKAPGLYYLELFFEDKLYHQKILVQ
jgi:hypothetical protein